MSCWCHCRRAFAASQMNMIITNETQNSAQTQRKNTFIFKIEDERHPHNLVSAIFGKPTRVGRNVTYLFVIMKMESELVDPVKC